MKKVKLAIIGCGGMGCAHANRLKDNPDAQIVAVCDTLEECSKRMIERCLTDYPAPRIYTDQETMYKKEELDGVIIVTPHTMHFQHGTRALDAGCHVLMEKPMVTDSDQAQKLAAYVQEMGKIFVIGYNTPCSPEFAYLRQLIRSKELGRLQTVTGWQCQDWRRATKGTWRQDPTLSGGGQMYDSGAHMFNSLVWTVEQPVDEVMAFLDNMDTPVDIVGTVNIRFVDGTIAVMTINGNCGVGGGGMYYGFEDGRVDVDGWAGQWIKVFKRGVGEVKYPPITGEAQSSVGNFVNAILGREEPRTGPIHGIMQSELMDAVYESARTNQIVKVKSAITKSVAAELAK